ncbi:hypothetical protein Golax_008424, partial [Gossypium laxum]|nr:hypothetical protein [Gossypium laxum]
MLPYQGAKLLLNLGIVEGSILWAEWNGKYRDDLRRFIKDSSRIKFTLMTLQYQCSLRHAKGARMSIILRCKVQTKDSHGDPGMKGAFATRVSGSADLYR